MTFNYLTFYKVSKILFSDGWLFFVPYLGCYLCFKYLNLGVSYCQNIFLFLHILNILLFIQYQSTLFKKNKLCNILFWIFLILLFQIPGAYLEFPSDAWAHFSRIFSWQDFNFVGDGSFNYKFTYFWGWTLMSEVEPLHRRIALNVYSTFWQILLAYQFYLFAIRLGFSKAWAKVQVFGSICLFGANLFSFYRYYALSSTPLAYIAYLRSLIVILDIFQGQRIQAFKLIFLLPLIYYNHYQELLLLFVSTLAISITVLYEKLDLSSKIKFTYIVAVILLFSFSLGSLAVVNFSQYSEIINYLWRNYLQIYFKNKDVQVWQIDQNYWSDWGVLKIWDTNLPYFQVLGLPGCISLIFSGIFWKKYKLLSTLSLMPILALLFQPFNLLIAAIENHYTTFRILFAFPYSFMLIVGIKEILLFLGNRLIFWRRSCFHSYWFISFLVILLSCQPANPYRGKLWFQLYNPPAQLSLENLDVTAQWFFENRRSNFPCLMVSDQAVTSLLAAQLSVPLEDNRLHIYNPSQIIKSVHELQVYLQSQVELDVCDNFSILVGIPSKIESPPVSKVGQLSKHWIPDTVRKDLDYSKEFVEATSTLEFNGWAKTFVPPFYWLYETTSMKSIF